MATPLPTHDILGVFKSLKDDIQSTLLTPKGLSIKSCGTKALALAEPTDVTTGFWNIPQSVSSKPPRWIIQVEGQTSGGLAARFALDATGSPIPMGRTLGYINNRDGSCAVCAFRVLPAVKPARLGSPWEFPEGWEYLLIVAFEQPLPAGTSGDPLTDFNPTAGTIDFGGGAARRSYNIAFRAVVKVPCAISISTGTTYHDTGQAIATFAGAMLYDGTRDGDRTRLVTDLSAVFGPATGAAEPFTIAEDTSLVGVNPSVYRQIEAAVNSGKRHIILYGPPGTGKTTLAEYLAREISERGNGDGSYVMLTASSAWSVQDLVGGYQPLGGGAIGFIPGAMLRNFDKPTIIDELNRCPIDKVLGPLFSILSGQASVLPCRADAADPKSPFHVVFPEIRAGMASHEHAPEATWRLICTLNTYDKTQLGQISYALSRRFAWIKVGAPWDQDNFTEEMARQLGVTVPNPVPANPIGAMWRAVNAAREIGGAPIVDFLKTLRAIDRSADWFAHPVGASADAFLSAFNMCVLPLMDGLSPREATDLATNVAAAWTLDAKRADRLMLDCREFSA